MLIGGWGVLGAAFLRPTTPSTSEDDAERMILAAEVLTLDRSRHIQLAVGVTVVNAIVPTLVQKLREHPEAETLDGVEGALDLIDEVVVALLAWRDTIRAMPMNAELRALLAAQAIKRHRDPR